jgi:hypothetical protein
MKQLKRIGRRLAALTAPYDVPADHVYSRQSLDAHNREFPLATPSAAETNTTEGSFSLSAADLRGSAA